MKEIKTSQEQAEKPFVLGLLSLILGIIGLVAAPLAIIGLVLGIIGLVRKNNKALCIIGLVISILAVIVSAGSSSGQSGTISSRNGTAESGNNDSANSLADQFTVEEHLYEDSISTTDYLVITNNSDQNVSIFGNATALDSSGASIGAADCSIDVLGPGEQTITDFYFSDVEDVDHVDYQLTYKVTNDYQPVISDLSTKVTVNDQNAVVAVTNNGDKAADFVEVYGLFYDAKGNVVYAMSTFTVDDDEELKPGATLTAQLDCYEPFDHVDVYLTGRR